MAEIYVMSEQQQKTWDDWLVTRPPIIQELAKKFRQNRLYRHNVTGQLVIPTALHEDGTVEVIVPRRLNNYILPTKKVFGIHPDKLEECDLPEGMKVMSFEEADNFMD